MNLNLKQLEHLLAVAQTGSFSKAAEQLREAGIPLGHALLEPAGRNTAPALTLAALAAVNTLR
mgnify:CR=1 FL=1